MAVPERNWKDDEYIASNATIQNLKTANTNCTSKLKSHAINDSGANISIATVQLAKEAIRRGFQVYPHEGEVKIKTAGEGANLRIAGWIQLGGYFGDMAVSLDAGFNLI